MMNGRMRRYVEWRINVYDYGYEVVREENGQIHRIGGSRVASHAEGIVRGDRILVLYDPMAVEVRPPQYDFNGLD